MNYFQFLARPRQAVFCFAVLFIFSISSQSFAQEIDKEIKPEENQKTIQPADQTETPITAATPDALVMSDAKALTARNFSKSPPPENQKFRDFSFAAETENKQQSSSSADDDDTMMGLMGKSSDKIKLGGHVGFVVPIVGRGGGVTTNVGDRFVFGFPVGLTVKTKKNLAVDFEFIPTFNTGRDFVLTIHPGIIYGFAKKYAVGVRAAYDAGAGSYGFTPLVSRGFKINDKVGFFLEADFPIRSNYRPYGDRFGSIAFAAHAGFAF